VSEPAQHALRHWLDAIDCFERQHGSCSFEPAGGKNVGTRSVPITSALASAPSVITVWLP
jgi:hypothetical protein